MLDINARDDYNSRSRIRSAMKIVATCLEIYITIHSSTRKSQNQAYEMLAIAITIHAPV